jgi:hypothetical protein
MTPDLPSSAEQLREKTAEALSATRECAENALSEGSRCIRERPGLSLLIALVVGLVLGALLGRALRPAPRRVFLDSVSDSREKLADLFGNVATNLRGPLEKTVSSVSDGAHNLADSVSHAWEKVRPARLRGWWN